jgi:streptogramin lyase
LNVYLGIVNVSTSAYWNQTATTVAGQANGTAGSSINYLYWNRGISITSDDILYIADRVNNRVVFVPLDGSATINTFGSGPGSGTNQFNYPCDISVIGTSVYVLDAYNYRVQKWLKNGTNPVTMPGAGLFDTSYNMFVDENGNLYLSNYNDNKVILFASNSSISQTVAGNGIAGLSANQLSGPNGVFVNDAKTLYVADTLNHRIQKWIYGALSGVTVAGTNGTSGGSLTQLCYPESLRVDTNGYIYIVDRGNNRIVRWAPNATSGICVVACTGVQGAQPNNLYFPIDIEFDSNGSLYVSDDGNSRVQKFEILNNNSEYSIV